MTLANLDKGVTSSVRGSIARFLTRHLCARSALGRRSLQSNVARSRAQHSEEEGDRGTGEIFHGHFFIHVVVKIERRRRREEGEG